MKYLYAFFIFLFQSLYVNSDVIEYTLPDMVNGVKKPSISLNGIWEFQYSRDGAWNDIQVPGEIAMQGFAIEHDKPYYYKKRFSIPDDFKDKRVILRFDGVYCYARLWINGHFVREHFGGFTRWEADITQWIKVGNNNELKLEVTDLKDDISYASGYAHHPVGGILRDVTLYALPQAGLYNFSVETDLDSLYENAVLKITYQIPMKSNLRVRFNLLGNDGKKIDLLSIRTYGNDSLRYHLFSVDNPLKWDAEHPNLYTLETIVEDYAIQTYSFRRKIGFRKIEIEKNQMFVNGKSIKLRGACRHDMHPMLGRTTTDELDWLDAKLFKKANMNFVRTSHYPPTERFLRYCDELGIYVECETALCFVDTWRQKNYLPAKSQDDIKYAERYMSQLQEMIIAFRSNPSVLFWSIGNESRYGKNIQRSYDWVKQADTTRPVVFSYPGSVEKGKRAFDLLSIHYPDYNGFQDEHNVVVNRFDNKNIPSLFDEWAHVPCYVYKTLQNDPNVRDFWGISLDKMWSKLFKSKGGLGGAVWGYVDETFMLPKPKFGVPFWQEFAKTSKPKDISGDCVGYGEWGIVDVWRREKPEFWGTKKAYSPIRVLDTDIEDFIEGEDIPIPIYNRFDHTNLEELSIRYTLRNNTVKVASPNIAPHQRGLLLLPGKLLKNGDELFIEFLEANGQIIDAEMIHLGKKPEIETIDLISGFIQVSETATEIVVKGQDFSVYFDKSTGLINQAFSNKRKIIEGGPFLHLDVNIEHLLGSELQGEGNYIVANECWKKDKIIYSQSEKNVTVKLVGSYNDINFHLIFIIWPNGKIDISYQADNVPNGWLREAGLEFGLTQEVTKIDWKRKGYWSYYPEHCLSPNVGTAMLYNDKVTGYGEEPSSFWGNDTYNYYYWGNSGSCSKRPLTNRAKSMKENISLYVLKSDDDESLLSVHSPLNKLACRLGKGSDECLRLYINNAWDYPEIGWGNYCQELDSNPVYGKISISL